MRRPLWYGFLDIYTINKKGQVQRVCYLLCNKEGEMRKCTFTPSFEEKTAQELKNKRLVRSVTYRISLGGNGVKRRGNGGGNGTSHHASSYRPTLWSYVISHIFLNE